jgi:hypothetical protein
MLHEVQVQSYNGDWMPYGPHKKALIASVVWNKESSLSVSDEALNHVKLGTTNVAYLRIELRCVF